MGTTYTNFQVRSASQGAVVEASAVLLKEPAYVSVAVSGWVGVYHEGSRADDDTFAKKLSARLACGVFSWGVYDSDTFLYSLYEYGKLLDRFDSNPDGYEPAGKARKARLRGKPRVIVPFCLPSIELAQVQEVLHPPLLKKIEAEGRREKYLFADYQAGDFARLLGIAEELEHCCYRDVAGAGGHYAGRDFVHISPNMLLPRNLTKKLWELPMQVEDIRAAISLGADVNERTEYGETFLLLAAFHCAAGVVRLLLESGADVNAATTKRNEYGWEDRGWTALMAAVQGGPNVADGAEAMNTAPQIETVQLLINAGAEVNAKNEVGWTALKEVQENMEHFSGRKGDRWYSKEALAECVARNKTLIEMLRAAGATA